MTALTHLTVAISTIGSSETPDQQDNYRGSRDCTAFLACGDETRCAVV